MDRENSSQNVFILRNYIILKIFMMKKSCNSIQKSLLRRLTAAGWLELSSERHFYLMWVRIADLAHKLGSRGAVESDWADWLPVLGHPATLESLSSPAKQLLQCLRLMWCIPYLQMQILANTDPKARARPLPVTLPKSNLNFQVNDNLTWCEVFSVLLQCSVLQWSLDGSQSWS